jgi:hypothetical protein
VRRWARALRPDGLCLPSAVRLVRSGLRCLPPVLPACGQPSGTCACGSAPSHRLNPAPLGRDILMFYVLGGVKCEQTLRSPVHLAPRSLLPPLPLPPADRSKWRPRPPSRRPAISSRHARLLLKLVGRRLTALGLASWTSSAQSLRASTSTSTRAAFRSLSRTPRTSSTSASSSPNRRSIRDARLSPPPSVRSVVSGIRGLWGEKLGPLLLPLPLPDFSRPLSRSLRQYLH